MQNMHHEQIWIYWICFDHDQMHETHIAIHSSLWAINLINIKDVMNIMNNDIKRQSATIIIDKIFVKLITDWRGQLYDDFYVYPVISVQLMGHFCIESDIIVP